MPKRKRVEEQVESDVEEEFEDAGEAEDLSGHEMEDDSGHHHDNEDDNDDDGFVKVKEHERMRGRQEREQQQQASEEQDDENFIKSMKVKKSSSGGFQTMGLSKDLLRAVIKKGYKVPTPIQRKCIPLIMEGHDVVGMARTGSGKTAAFLIPLIEKLKTHSPKAGARGIVLSPSRELALQTLKFAKELCKFTNLRCALLVGGDSLEDQFVQMTSNPDIVIGTPGRFLHLVVEMDLSLKAVEYIVFDEADRLFESGFAAQLHEIMSKLPDSRQTVLFSATLPKLLVEFAKAGLHDPTLVRLDTDIKISAELEMAFLSTAKEEKISLLLFLLREVIKPKHLTIIFVATKHHVEYLYHILSRAGIDSTTIYGALDQTARKINLAKFRTGKTKILIVTDVASRGIDIPLLENVINFDFPPTPKLFVHRVGRAARAGRAGFAYSLVSQEEVPYLLDLQLFLGRPLLTSFPDDSSLEDIDLKASVSFGSAPRNVYQDATEELAHLHEKYVEISNLKGVVSNATKLYAKSRPLASSQSYVRAKELAETPLDVHPVLRSFITANEILVQDFLLSIKNFKPHETIFETNTTKRDENVMKAKREVDDKKIKAKKAKSSQKKETLLKPDVDKEVKPQIQEADETFVEEAFSSILGRKPKAAAPTSLQVVQPKATSSRDEEYYISYEQANQNTEKGYALKDGTFFEQARSAEVDFTGDDNDTMKKQKNTLIWDRKKKKFVRASNATKDLSGQVVKTESGKRINSTYKTKAFDEWKAKNKYSASNADQPLQMVRRYDGRWVPKQNVAEAKSRGDDGDWGGEGAKDEGGPPKKKQKFGNGSFIGTRDNSVQQSGNRAAKQPGGKGKGNGNENENGKGQQRDRGKKKGPEMGTVTKGKKGMRREIKSVEQIKKQRRIAQFRQKKVAKSQRLSRSKKPGRH